MKVKESTSKSMAKIVMTHTMFEDQLMMFNNKYTEFLIEKNLAFKLACGRA